MTSDELRQAEIDEWNAFPDLPGVHLQVHQGTRFRTIDLVRSDAVIVAQRQLARPFGSGRITVDSDTFEVRYARTRGFRRRREVIDIAANEPIFRIEGRHFNRKADAVIYLSPSRWYSFPVHGFNHKPRYAVMNAVDQSNRVALRFRRVKGQELVRGFLRWRTEVVVEPGREITPTLLAVVLTAAPFLVSYFASGGGG